ncbi:Rgg/GadR/MutR family transcriptional regulator [Enterococcus sp.]
MNHGEMIKKMRITRGISRKELTKDAISISTLQRFENEDAKIDIDNMWIILNRLNIQIDEYYLEYNHYQSNKKEMYRSKFRDYIVLSNRGKTFLEELQREYIVTNDIFYLYLVIQAKAVMNRLPNYSAIPITKEELKSIHDYLDRVNQWGYFELAMYTNCLAFFNSELRLFNYHDVVSQFRKFKNSPKHNLAFIKFLINSILLAFEDEHLDEVVDLLGYLYDITNDSDFIKGRLYWKFFSRLYQSITGKFEFDGSMTIEVFKLLGY